MISCRHDPTLLNDVPTSTYQCPDCSILLIPGYPHPDDDACRFQNDEWEPPDYGDEPE